MDEVIQVAPNRARRNELRADLKIRNLRPGVGQQPKLQLMRERQIAFEALLLFGDLLVEPGVLDRNRYLRCKCREGTLVIFGEISATGVLEIENSDHLFLVDERHRQLRPRFRIQQNVARIFADVRDQHRFFALGRIAYQSATNRNVVLEVESLLKTQRKTVSQLLAVGVYQQHTEHLVIDDPAEQFSYSLQQFVQIED